MNKEGWICPICGKANAPWRPSCDCHKKKSTTIEGILAECALNSDEVIEEEDK